MNSVDVLLKVIRTVGSDWLESGPEGPRVGVGHCAYCKGLCRGATSMCQMRVWHLAQMVHGR